MPKVTDDMKIHYKLGSLLGSLIVRDSVRVNQFVRQSHFVIGRTPVSLQLNQLKRNIG